MTLLPCTGIVWPVPAAVQVRPRQGAWVRPVGRDLPFSERGTWPGPHRPVPARGLACGMLAINPIRSGPACCAAVYWPNTASRRHTPHARAGLITSRDQRSGSPPANTRRYALPEPCVFNRSAALRCDIRRACRGKRSALGPALGIPRTRRMGAVLTDDSPARFGAPFGTYAIEPSLRRMVCRGTVQPLAGARIRPSGPE